MKNGRSTVGLLAALMVLVLGLALAACGGSSDSSSTAEATTESEATTETEAPSTSGAVDEATAFVEARLEVPKDIGFSEPVSKAPEPGKNIAMVACGVPSCEVGLAEAFKEATEAIGWNVKVYKAGSTAETISRAWDQVVADKPDAVVSVALPLSTWEKYLPELKAAGIPVINDADIAPEEPGIITSVINEEEYVERGKWLANWVVAKAGDEASVQWVNLPVFNVLGAVEEGFNEELSSICPNCKTATMGVEPTTIGTTLPEVIVNKLRSNPGVNYVLLGVGDMAIGLPPALKAAGLEDVKIASNLEPTGSWEMLEEPGSPYEVVVPESLPVTAWKWADALARHFAGDELPHEWYATGPKNFVTKDNIVDPKLPYIGPADYQEEFLAMWGVK